MRKQTPDEVVDFDAWIQLRGLVDGLPAAERRRILRARRISPPLYDAAEVIHLEAMASASARGDQAMVKRFATGSKRGLDPDTTLPPFSAKPADVPFQPGVFAPPASTDATHDPMGDTVPVGHASKDATMPFTQPATMRLLRFGDFVALSQDLRRRPEERDLTIRAAGLKGEAEFLEVARVWAMRMDASPELRERFERAVGAP